MFEPETAEPMVAGNEKSEEAPKPNENETKPDMEEKPSMEVKPSTTTEAAPAEEAPPMLVDAAPTQSTPGPPEISPNPIEKHDEPPSSYKRQFSAATSRRILSRLHGNTGTSPSPPIPSLPNSQPPTPPRITNGESNGQPIKSIPSTLYLPLSSTAAVRSLSQPRSTTSPVGGAKRKREAEDEGPNRPAYPVTQNEPEQFTRPMPKAPVKRKRVKDDGMCVKCKRISFTDANQIIPCACGEAWHQLCHEPEIAAEVARERSQFKCATCVEEEREMVKHQRAMAKYREAKQQFISRMRQQNDVAKMREKRLATLPEFIKPELVGFEGGNASSHARREYFSGLRKTDLLNLISFSDRIQPGLLVDILVSVSKKHPDLPIFSSPDWAQPRTYQPEPQPRQTEHPNHLARPKPSKQRSKTGGVRKILKTAPAGAVDEDDDDDVLPESWPKPGHGLYARLKPEKDDPVLYDNNDEEAFSHFMVDKQGKQIMEPLKG
ncbi:hypothetical protein CCHL11_00190 [Colletotrichum chlorophyti]|uniref:Zinc finger PHD-type domain-containing protein n=1 Tax=Colletotrichum chlorophyti TaxID=708187 RepID=A0A1Q8RV68_9PEZI|nr:hypothetical protein CCHL11_00190 [Colletotrichum chlorophyti]